MANKLETGNFASRENQAAGDYEFFPGAKSSKEENHQKRAIKVKVIDLEEIRFLEKVGRTQWNKLNPNHHSHNHPDDPLNCQRSSALKKNLMKV